MMRLDDLALRRCDLIKIDIEGMEYGALLGAREMIARHRPFIYFEQTRADNFAETFALLAGAGYRLFWHVADPFNRNNFRGAADEHLRGHAGGECFRIAEGKGGGATDGDGALAADRRRGLRAAAATGFGGGVGNAGGCLWRAAAGGARGAVGGPCAKE